MSHESDLTRAVEKALLISSLGRLRKTQRFLSSNFWRAGPSIPRRIQIFGHCPSSRGGDGNRRSPDLICGLSEKGLELQSSISRGERLGLCAPSTCVSRNRINQPNGFRGSLYQLSTSSSYCQATPAHRIYLLHTNVQHIGFLVGPFTTPPFAVNTLNSRSLASLRTPIRLPLLRLNGTAVV